jgi:PAS domain S-box-containing protein
MTGRGVTHGTTNTPVGEDFASRELFRAAFDDASVAMLLTLPDGRFVRANRAAASLLGYGDGELERLTAQEVTPSWEQEGLAQRFEAMAQGTVGSVEVERQFVRKDGTLVWTHTNVSPVRDRTGETRYFMAQVQNVSARREAEEALRRSEDLYRVVVENSRDLISLIDLGGRLLFVSGAYGRMLGYDPPRLVGTYVRDLVHPDDIELAQAAFSASAEVTASLPTVRVRRADGGYVPVETNAGYVYDNDGAPVAVLSMSRDVSDRARTEELEERLRQAEKMQAVGQLAGGVAHDFNNLLTVIRGYEEIAARALEDDPRRVREALAEIRRAADSAAQLTRQLLAFGRQQVLQPKVLDLNDVVREYRQLLERTLGDHVAVELALDPQLGRVRADTLQLGQVILNLAVNARDAMPYGGRLTIETANVELARGDTDHDTPPGSFVQLRFSDTGDGIDAATMQRVFEPFFTTKEKGSGTGLGLSTVFGIVKQSGGQIRVASTPGVGATFVVSLPRVDEAIAPDPEPAELTLPLGYGRVLVVEDNDVVRTLTCEILGQHGYEVESDAHPEEALARAARETEPYDLLVTDVVMPEINGRELAEQLRERWPDMRVLFISGYTDDAMIASGMLAPGSRFLQKPFTLQALAQAAHDVLTA